MASVWPQYTSPSCYSSYTLSILYNYFLQRFKIIFYTYHKLLQTSKLSKKLHFYFLHLKQIAFIYYKYKRHFEPWIFIFISYIRWFLLDKEKMCFFFDISTCESLISILLQADINLFEVTWYYFWCFLNLIYLICVIFN